MALAIISIGTIWYLIAGGEDLADRSTLPEQMDVIVGCVFIVLVLEAARRSTGWIMPAVAVMFIAYAVFGPYLPPPWTHRGYDLERLSGQLYITLEGIFGPAIDVSSSLIILFTIFGAILQFSGAGQFFINFSFNLMGGKPTSAGRAVTLASFLLGGPSGSGVATTVTLGSVAYPMLAKAGYGKNDAGGLLAAGGLGAILSPPVLGAAAFLIAEFLKISYLDVIRMAVVPTCFYYFALFAMVELDAGRFGIRDVTVERRESLWDDDEAARLSLHVADLDHRLHADGLLARMVGVLLRPSRDRGQLPARVIPPCFRHGSSRPWRPARSACSTSPRPAPRPASSSAS